MDDELPVAWFDDKFVAVVPTDVNVTVEMIVAFSLWTDDVLPVDESEDGFVTVDPTVVNVTVAITVPFSLSWLEELAVDDPEAIVELGNGVVDETTVV